MTARATLARSVAAGTAKMTSAYTIEASTFGGPRDGPGYHGYKSEDLRYWVYPDVFACAELSTNPSAPLADLDYRALMMLLPIAQRHALIAARVPGDPSTGLPHRWPFRISHGVDTAVCGKLDIGRGSAPAHGSPRAVDLFWVVAAWLGVENLTTGPWLGLVTVQIALP
jgi:hypothetical protein